MRLQKGGVGYYPSSYSSFVHLDSGSVRSWPRMTRDQLVRIFPDEKTVHLPKDNKPLSGYEEAKAEILSRGGSVVGYAALDDEGSTGPRKSFWARLFGGDDDEDTEFYQASARMARGRPAGGTPAQVAGRPQMAAAAFATGAPSEDGAMRTALAFTAPDPAPSAPLPMARRGRGAQVAALPDAAEATDVQAEPAAGDADRAAPPRLALAPMPPRRPDDIVALATAGFAPLPPSRPVELAALGGAELPKDAGPRADAQATPRPGSRTAEDRAQLRDLFAAVASDGVPVDKARVATARARPRAEVPSGSVVEPGAGLRLGFSPGPVADLGANRFAGPAVRPLPLLR
jgi:hypothetical protein